MILFSVVFSPVNLNWEKLLQFLRKALGKTKITIGQYKFYPFLIKCLKRLYMCKGLYGYLESHNILYPLQFGFRQKCSTNHALIQITESIHNSTENNEFGCGIFIDLKKAFDTVNHCVVPENIQAPTTEGIGNSRGVGGSEAQEIPEGRGVGP